MLDWIPLTTSSIDKENDRLFRRVENYFTVCVIYRITDKFQWMSRPVHRKKALVSEFIHHFERNISAKMRAHYEFFN